MCTIDLNFQGCPHTTEQHHHLYILKAQSPHVNNDLWDKLMILSDCNHAGTGSTWSRALDENSKG